jgi:formylglycine-generating enzyme required for sulfatase activity
VVRAQERSARAQRELDEAQRVLDEAYARRVEEQERARAVLEADAARDWQEIEAAFGRSASPASPAAQREGRWSWAAVQAATQSQLSDEDQRKMLLNFIKNYEEIDAFQDLVEEAQVRYTWLNRKVQWVTIRGGRFLIGSTFPVEDEWPMQWVEIKSFQISISEVTNAQYKACVDSNACTPPHWDDGKCHIFADQRLFYGALPTAWRRGDMPVVCVDWAQANAFARWAGGRLLSESEWEFSARSGERSFVYPWGTEEAGCDRAVMSIELVSGCGLGAFWPVCSRPAGSNSYGVCDLAGNVWEWVMDIYRPNHERVPPDGSPVLGGGVKVIRGGGFSSSHKGLRASTRGQVPPSQPSAYVGIRVARDFEEGF